MITNEDISHIGLEVTDLQKAERCYTEALGMKLLHRDNGDLGHGRLILQNGSGQLLFLEAVDQLSPRSRFCGPDENNPAPSPENRSVLVTSSGARSGLPKPLTSIPASAG